ncbi:MAG: hypothetical protein IH936_13185 [Acidobacteria bacterium]|nr:hypothetical protein [Acidobacteriota bacterium]
MSIRKTAAIAAMLACLPFLTSSPAGAQCPLASVSSLFEENPTFSEPSPDDNLFCDGVITVDCGGFNPGFLLDLELSGRFGVDLTCTSTLAGAPTNRVCAVTSSCDALSFSHPSGQHTVRLSGDYESTSIKLAVVGSDDTCHSQSTVRCVGNWGSPFQCFPLNLEHEGQGADPVATPRQSENCPQGEYRSGEDVDLEASPAAGWEVDSWEGTDNDSSSSTQNSLTVSDGTQAVTVVYVMAAPTCNALRLSHAGQGTDPTATPSQSDGCNPGEFKGGETIQLAATPAGGWEMDSWRGTDSDRSATTTNVATMPNAPHTVLAVYRETHFRSGFEEPDFGDWSDYFCPACNSFSAYVNEGESSRPQSTWYETDGPGVHRGSVQGGAELELQLELLKWDGSDWMAVATGVGTGKAEVSFDGPPGVFQWQVSSTAGSGPFELSIEQPSSKAAVNRLGQSASAARQESFGLESVYVAGVKGKAFLTDESPGIGGGESDYRASFQIRATPGLTVKGKKQTILAAMQGGSRKVFEVFLRKTRGEYIVQVRPRSGGRKGVKSPTFDISTTSWTEIEIQWRAASSNGANDGFLRVLKEGVEEWEVSLDNFGDRVESVRFGQISKGKRPTAGLVYYDDFDSSWSN